MTKSQQFLVTIDKMVSGGFGLGRRPDGMVVLVRHVLPGETVRLRPVCRKKSYMEAALLEVLTASPDRIAPPCGLYGQCGGCDLQHAAITTQHRLKREILLETLARGGGRRFEQSGAPVAAVLPSPAAYGYRQRIRLHVDEHGQMGFHRGRSGRIEPLAACLLARPELNAALRQLYESAAMAGLLKQSTAVELLLNPDSGKVVVLLHFNRPPRPMDRTQARAVVAEIAGIEGLLMYVAGHGFIRPAGQGANGGDAVLLQFTLPPGITGSRNLRLTWEAGGFCQVNLAQNNNLVGLVRAWAQAGARDRVLDLYCGMGNFALPLSLTAREVVGLDGQGSAIRSAGRNAALACEDRGDDIRPNCRFLQTAVPAGVQTLAAARERFDIIVLDPPRSGAADLIPHLAALGAGRIIYISCDPATLARDLVLLGGAGYDARRITPVDMFPQTHHLETVVLLERQA